MRPSALPFSAAAREHHLAVARTARYYVLGEPSPAVRELWIVLHGYGQLAGRFVRRFDVLADPTRLLVAPEALSRFYRGTDVTAHAQARVGATWMTREDRLAEIDDYVGYLSQLHARLRDGLRADVVLHVVGFSQGAATACRWLAFGRPTVRRLVLWGGAIPDDLDLAAHGAALAAADLTLVTGSADPFRTVEAVRAQEQRLHDHRVPFRHVRYEGGHHLHDATLRALAG